MPRGRHRRRLTIVRRTSVPVPTVPWAERGPGASMRAFQRPHWTEDPWVRRAWNGTLVAALVVLALVVGLALG